MNPLNELNDNDLEFLANYGADFPVGTEQYTNALDAQDILDARFVADETDEFASVDPRDLEWLE